MIDTKKERWNQEKIFLDFETIIFIFISNLAYIITYKGETRKKKGYIMHKL